MPFVATHTTKSSSTARGEAPTENPVNERNTELRTRYLEAEAALAALTDDPSDALSAKKLTRVLEDIAEQFIDTNIGLAAAVVKRWCKNPANSEDLLQEGIVTLWEYFLTWDPTRAKYSTWVMQSLEGDIRRLDLKLTGQEKYSDRLARGPLLDAVDHLTRVLGRTPSNAELAERTGMTLERVARMRRGKTISLDDPIGSEGATRGDLVPDPYGDFKDTRAGVELARDLFGTAKVNVDDLPGTEAERLWVMALANTTASLTPTELYVIIRSEGLDGWPSQTRSEIGDMLGLGREVVRRTEERAHQAIIERGLVLPKAL